MPNKPGRNGCRRPMSRLTWPPLLLSVGVGFWLGPVAAAKAQEALLSALSLDSVVKAQTNPPVAQQPDVPHLGPVQLSLGAYSSFQLDNNINLSQRDAESDAIVGGGVNLGFAWPATPESGLQFSSQIGYDYYLKHPADNYVQIAPGSALTWNFLVDDWDFTFFDQFNYTRNVTAVASVSNVSGIPIVNNTSGIRAQWQPGHWLVQAGYSYNDYFSTATTYNYLNNGSHYFFTRGAWLFAGGAQLGVEGSVSITDYSHQSQSDNTSYSLGPYLEWPITEFLNLSLHGGPTFFSFDSPPSGGAASSLGSYYVNFDLTHHFTAFISEEFSVERSVSESYTPGTPYVEQLSASYLVRWYPKPWLNFWLGLDYQVGQQPYTEFFFSTTENYDRYGINPGVSYQITQKISTSLSYFHWTRGSNIPGNSYHDDNISFQLQYTF